MRTFALMQELRDRLAPGASTPSTPAAAAPSSDWPRLPCGPAPKDRALLERCKKATIAKIGVGRAGVRLRTKTLLEFLAGRAVAVEAVRSRLPDGFAAQVNAAVQVHTEAKDLDEFLVRPDLGRRLPPDQLQRVIAAVPRGVDVLVLVGDGLSANAVAHNAPGFLRSFYAEAQRLGFSTSPVVLVERCRVKVQDQAGEAVGAKLSVILVGERPGLGTGDGMSAYLVFQPRDGTFDSDREVVSNIHERGIVPEEAGRKCAGMLAEFVKAGASGVKRLSSAPPSQPVGPAQPGDRAPRAGELAAAYEAPPLARAPFGAAAAVGLPSLHGDRLPDKIGKHEPPPLQTVAGARCAG